MSNDFNSSVVSCQEENSRIEDILQNRVEVSARSSEIKALGVFYSNMPAKDTIKNGNTQSDTPVIKESKKLLKKKQRKGTFHSISDKYVKNPERPLSIMGISKFKELIEKTESLDWEAINQDFIEEHAENIYNKHSEVIHLVGRVLNDTLLENEIPIIKRDDEDIFFFFNGKCFESISIDKVTSFFKAMAHRYGLSYDMLNKTARSKELFEKVKIEIINHSLFPKVPSFSYINCNNGLLAFEKNTIDLIEHTPQYYINYVLPYNSKHENLNFRSDKFHSFLDEMLPDKEWQIEAAKCAAIPFYYGRLEKVPVFHGEPATGKSTFFHLITRVYGECNVTHVELSKLAMSGSEGQYARANLANSIVNIDDDAPAYFDSSCDSILKRLFSNDTISARNPYEKATELSNYAKIFIGCNEIPSRFLTEEAFKRRVDIIPCERRIPESFRNTEFEHSFTNDDYAGILNWIIQDGLLVMINDPKFDKFAKSERLNKKTQMLYFENDPIQMWIDDLRFIKAEKIELGEKLTGVKTINAIELLNKFRAFCNLRRFTKISNNMNTRSLLKKLREHPYSFQTGQINKNNTLGTNGDQFLFYRMKGECEE